MVKHLTRFIIERLDERAQWLEAHVGDDWSWALADVEAKRRIVWLHTGYHCCAGGDETEVHVFDYQCPTLLALARLESAHPDFESEWLSDRS